METDKNDECLPSKFTARCSPSAISYLIVDVIVNVTPADNEQTVRVPKTRELVKRPAQAG